MAEVGKLKGQLQSKEQHVTLLQEQVEAAEQQIQDLQSCLKQHGIRVSSTSDGGALPAEPDSSDPAALACGSSSDQQHMEQAKALQQAEGDIAELQSTTSSSTAGPAGAATATDRAPSLAQLESLQLEVQQLQLQVQQLKQELADAKAAAATAASELIESKKKFVLVGVDPDLDAQLSEALEAEPWHSQLISPMPPSKDAAGQALSNLWHRFRARCLTLLLL
eukprot:gene9735-9893_t